MSTEKIADMANVSIGKCHCALPHPFEMLEDMPAPEERASKQDKDDQWMQTSPNMRVYALAQVDVYLDDFISTCQGGPSERRQMLRHLFWSIVTVFRPNI